MGGTDSKSHKIDAPERIQSADITQRAARTSLNWERGSRYHMDGMQDGKPVFRISIAYTRPTAHIELWRVGDNRAAVDRRIVQADDEAEKRAAVAELKIRAEELR